MHEIKKAEGSHNSNSKKPTNLEKLEKITELVGKSFLFLGAMSYVLGVIVVSIYLSKYNSPAMSLLKINYVLTGMWVLIPLFWVIILICLIIIPWYSLEPLNLKTWSKIGCYIVIEPIIIGVFIYVIYRLATRLDIDMAMGWEIRLIILFVGIFVSIIIVYQWKKISIQAPSINKWLVCAARNSIVLCIAIIPFYIYHFSFDAYTKIPFQYGGAQYLPVQIFVDQNSQLNDIFEKYKLEKNGSGWNGLLMFSTDYDYLFCHQDANEALLIKKEDIKAIKTQIKPPEEKSKIPLIKPKK